LLLLAASGPNPPLEPALAHFRKEFFIMVNEEPAFTIDREPAVPIGQVRRELGWTYQRLRSEQQACDFFDGEPLVFRLGRYTETGIEEPGLTEREYKDLKDKIQQAATGEFTCQTVCRWSLSRALRELFVPNVLEVMARALASWTYWDHCRALGGKLDAISLRLHPSFGFPELWLQKQHVLDMKKNLLRNVKADRRLRRSFAGTLRQTRKQRGMTQRDLAFEADVCVESLILWEKGDRLPRPRIAERLARALRISIEGLRFPKRSRKRQPVPQEAFKGVWRDDEGKPIAYTLRNAAPQLGRDLRTVKDDTEELPKSTANCFLSRGDCPLN
jgi:transcriptional regulator with XRE-family HTH domain